MARVQTPALETVDIVFTTRAVKIVSLPVLIIVKIIKRGKNRMEKINYKSVKWLLLSLNMNDYTHICVRERMRLYPPFGGYRYLGGGHPGKVIQRYGDRLVADSCILEDALILYVVPLDQQLSDHWGDYCNIGRTDGGVHICSCTGTCSSCSAADGVICPLDAEQ